ncbi:MAG: glycosyltransferase [Sphingobacteriales bacterium]|nr:MAG: glycosyltransferase [Sphingobacteriales bacterium]
MNKTKIIANPSKWEMFRLRVMIIAAMLVMTLFLLEILKSKFEYAILYYMLLATILYSCSRLLHEWLHYFYITVPPAQPAKKVFSVDVFTTFCKGEPYAMIEETLQAIVNIEYPHKSYLCDESDDPYLKSLCDQLGVIHVTRLVKKDAKAGNINNALQISSGELCVILDPDHVPQPDFLNPIVNHFNDEKIGFVQIVQAYKNYGESLVAKGAAQQTFQFYGPIMMTMNKYGTVLAIGANCTFRREALESIGGHAAGLAEDMNTAMHLHAKGWKSIYVPQILARGLVPATMSAYYAQQLKWSRGVFELLITSYPKLFSNFTWQQKLHYALIPIYYISGVISLINFLIPIVSLIFDTSPINIDFLYFMMFAGPLAFLSFLIRLFVQRWVMEEEERGFHVVGGLLMIGTWWIFLIGLFYTILRKKVPYNPTPKDSQGQEKWSINTPNIIVILVSIAAIIYGLTSDWNPYNLIMSAFAGINCLILSFSIFASRQTSLKEVEKRSPFLSNVSANIALLKKEFWIFRRFVYRFVRRTALLITVLVSAFIMLYAANNRYSSQPLLPENYNKNILIPGIFAPANSGGLSSIRNIKNIEQKNKIHFGIISLYLAWGDAQKSEFPTALLDSIYQRDAIPMITWEPWQSSFSTSNRFISEGRELNVFSRIVDHKYDQYLEDFAAKVKAVNKPMFLRFAHEADNPQYPWSRTGNNTPEEFKAAWKYIHTFFSDRHLDKLIWVWNPWKPSAIDSYFPGTQFVDWIGVTNLDYAQKDSSPYTMAQLYQPFHQNKIFKSGLPVMLAEMGSLSKKRTDWYRQAAKTLELKFPEIRAFVLFDSDVDTNIPSGYAEKTLDWKINDFAGLKSLFQAPNKRHNWLPMAQGNNPKKIAAPRKKVEFPLNDIKGVNYKRGQNWSSNGFVLKKKDIIKDMTEIKEMGFNTVKIYGFSIYDDNILEAAASANLRVAFSFWLPENISLIKNRAVMDKYKAKILSAVRNLKGNKNIVMWNIANNPINSLRYKNFKPDLFTERDAYYVWMNELVDEIRNIDASRPISLDANLDENFYEDYEHLVNGIPGIDYIGFIENQNPQMESPKLTSRNFMSSVSPESYLKNPDLQKAFFLSDWRDEKTTNYVSLNGIKDNTGKFKIESYAIAGQLGHSRKDIHIPKMRILLPAVTMWPGNQVTFQIITFDGKQWKLVDAEKFNFRWELIKYNQYQNPVEVVEIGTGKAVKITVPVNPGAYKLRLYIENQSVVKTIESKLNMPLNSAIIN